MWLIQPELAPMLDELSRLQKLTIQKSVHFSDVYIEEDGTLKMRSSQPRSKFFLRN